MTILDGSVDWFAQGHVEGFVTLYLAVAHHRHADALIGDSWRKGEGAAAAAIVAACCGATVAGGILDRDRVCTHPIQGDIQKQVEAAKSYFKLIDKGRSEGANTFIEWLDARNQLTTAEVQEQINKFRALIAWADYERQIAALNVN